MPTSEKQKAANRRNAQKPTGPKTVEGKTAVSRNAIKHGLYSSHIVLKPTHPTSSFPQQADGPPVKEDGSRIKVRDDRVEPG